MKDGRRLNLRRESEADERAIQFLKELVAAAPSQRNWHGILISLLVIGLVSSLIVTCVALLQPPDLGPRIRGHLITLEDVVDSIYKVHPDQAAWITDDDLSFRDDFGGVSVYNARTRSVTVLVGNTTMRRFEISRFAVSPDQKYVLLAGPETKITEFTAEAQYWLCYVQNGQTTPLTPRPQTVPLAQPRLQYAAWAGRRRRRGPSGRSDSALLMVHGGDIFYQARAVSSRAFAVTSGGQPGLVHHGVPDLLYAEHVLRSDHAVWPSPDGDLLLYFTVNCTSVSDLQYTMYGEDADPGYPRVYSVKYPRAGSTNPTLTVVVANVSNPKKITHHTVHPPPAMAQRDLYAAGVSWADNRRVSITWYNRRQNSSCLTICQPPDWKCRTVYQARPVPGWLTETSAPLFSTDGQKALLRSRESNGANGVFTQMLMVDIKSGSAIQITQENVDVHRILHWRSGSIYYLSAAADAVGQTHLYRMSNVSWPVVGAGRCLTCPSAVAAAAADGEPPCLLHDVLFSRSGRYALRCLGPAVPRLSVPAVAVADAAAGAARAPLVARNNTELRAGAANLSLPQLRLLQVALPAGGRALVRLLVPPQYRAGDPGTFSLLVRPAAAGVDHAWRVDYATYLASQHSFVVADVWLAQPPAAAADAHADVDALRHVLAHLTSSLEFLSSHRVAAIGRGFGGYLAIALLASPQAQLRCAVAVAPVTNWEVYASAPAEQRLGLPSDNQRRFAAWDLGGEAAALVGRQLMLVHGMADVSISVQHTFLLASKLQRAGVVFRQMVYPDEGHQLVGAVRHLWRTLDIYLRQCFLPEHVGQLDTEQI